MKKVFYIIGDSWLAHHTARATSSDCELFRDFFVINHSVPGASNTDIIRRIKVATKDMAELEIDPIFCVGLSEVGRGLIDEFRLTRPSSNLTAFLKSILLKEHEILRNELANYPHYICTAWVTNPFGTKSIIDFIDLDFSGINECYTVGNGIYQWVSDRANIFKLDKLSFVDAVDNKQLFESQLLKNRFINETLHLDKTTSDEVYEKFFNHVLNCLTH